MFNLKRAKLILCANGNLCCATFPPQIVIGFVEHSVFKNNEFFVFVKSDFFPLYASITKIVNNIANGITHDETGIISTKEDGNIYYWCLNQGSICLGIKCESKIVLQHSFSLENFNDFVIILSQLILPTICFKDDVFKCLDFASGCAIETLLKISNVNESVDFLKQTYSSSDHILAINLYYYLETVIIVKKMKSLYNFKPKKDILDRITKIAPPHPSNVPP